MATLPTNRKNLFTQITFNFLKIPNHFIIINNEDKEHNNYANNHFLYY